MLRPENNHLTRKRKLHWKIHFFLRSKKRENLPEIGPILRVLSPVRLFWTQSLKPVHRGLFASFRYLRVGRIVKRPPSVFRLASLPRQSKGKDNRSCTVMTVVRAFLLLVACGVFAEAYSNYNDEVSDSSRHLLLVATVIHSLMHAFFSFFLLHDFLANFSGSQWWSLQQELGSWNQAVHHVCSRPVCCQTCLGQLLPERQ